MNIETNLSVRNILWWLYSPYPIIAFLWGGYIMISGGNYPAISWLSISFDALGLFCFYCFLRQLPSFTRGFWILFAIFYVLKLIFALAILFSMATHTTWDGNYFNKIILLDFFGIILSIPFLSAIIMYAFKSKQIWSIQHKHS